MNFQGLGKVESADWYIDLAFRSANKLARGMKEQMRANPDSIKRVEISKISEIKKVLSRHLNMILTAFPSLDSLPEFYQQLLRVTLDYAELKKSLGGVRWAEQKIMFFSDSYSNKIKRCHEFKRMVAYSREYYGRICSVLKQVKKQLQYLEHSRRVMKEYPVVKTKMFTVAIAGFPNVGKTTLLSKLTGSTPEIADYAFTTKNLNVGYATIGNHKVQFIDTPGTLNRFEKMNLIEQQAYLAMKYCADIIVFVFDSSDAAYEARDQKKLLGAVSKIGKDVIVYASKMDLEHATLPKIPKTKIFQDIEALKGRLSKSLGDEGTN